MTVPEDHPRAVSLRVRHKLVDGFRRGLVADGGLIAHGRGEAFDYLLGERTTREAEAAEEAAVALMLCAKHPVISVNGNAAALAAEDLVKLASGVDAKIEVNLFYRTLEREKLIVGELRRAGGGRVFGLNKKFRIPGLGSERGNVDEALWGADVVLVLLEDGDRTEALRRAGKKVAAVDLNPLSRTAQTADVTIVDNIVRAVPNMTEFARKMKETPEGELAAVVDLFDNTRNLADAERLIRGGH